MKKSRQARWVLVVMAVLVLPAILSLRQIHLENEIENWLPANDPQAKTLAWYLDHFPQEDRILISWDGSSLDDPRIGRFVRRLSGLTDTMGARRGGLQQIRNVDAPQHLMERMVQAGVEPDEALRRLQGVLIGPGPDAPVAVSITLSEKGRADKSGTLSAIRQAAGEVGIEEQTLHMGGESLVGLALNQRVVEAAWNRHVPVFALHKRSVLLLSAAAGVLLAVFMLRSMRLAAMVLFISLYTTLLAVSLVPMTGGSMNMVLVVMPPLLIVLTLSAVIHVANYWKHASEENRDTAAAQAVRMARLPCSLASLTTAVGLLALSTSSLSPVRDFGLYSAVGCLIGLVMALVGFPALLQWAPPNRVGKVIANTSGRRRGGLFRARHPDRPPVHFSRSGKNQPAFSWQNWGLFVSRHWHSVTILSLAVFCVGIFGLRSFHTDIRVIRNFPEDSRIVQDFRFLEEQIAGVVPVEMIVRFDKRARSRLHFLQRMELVRELEDKLRAHPEISGTMSLTDFLPTYTPLDATACRLKRLLDHRKAHEVERRVKQDNETAAKAFLVMADEATDLSTTGDRSLNKAGDELWRITAHAGLVSDVNYADLTRDLHRIAGFVLQDYAGTGHVVTGMVPVFERAQEAVLEGLIRSFALAFGVIVLLMMIVLKNPLAGVMAMLPNLFPIGIVFGLVSWFGVWVDIGMMITAAIALGIAVDGTLHLLTWFRDGIAHKLTRQEAVVRALSHSGPALGQTSMVVALGMLMLSFSDLLLISRFGWMMAALIAAALVADVVFLPALLAGPLGSLMQKTLLTQSSRAEAEMAVPANESAEAAVPNHRIA